VSSSTAAASQAMQVSRSSEYASVERERRLRPTYFEADAALKSGSRRRLLKTKTQASLAVRRSHSMTAVVDALVSDGGRKFGDSFPTSVGAGF